MAIILDPVLFDLLEQSGTTLIRDKFQSEIGEMILDRSILKMINELSGNLYETVLRKEEVKFALDIMQNNLTVSAA